MPTVKEWNELTGNCTSEWTTLNGVGGRKFTSKKNGNSIFLPAAGYRYGDDLSNAGYYSGYWSSSLYSDYPGRAYLLDFNSGRVYTYDYNRYLGQSVRPVSE